MVVPTAAAVGTTRQQTASSSRMSQLSSKMDGCMLLKQQRCTKRVSVPQRGAGVCVQAFFNFNKGAAEESNESSLSRGDFDVQEVEDYFNYMGMLAAEVCVVLCVMVLRCVVCMVVFLGVEEVAVDGVVLPMLQGNYDRLDAMLSCT